MCIYEAINQVTCGTCALRSFNRADRKVHDFMASYVCSISLLRPPFCFSLLNYHIENPFCVLQFISLGHFVETIFLISICKSHVLGFVLARAAMSPRRAYTNPILKLLDKNSVAVFPLQKSTWVIFGVRTF